MRRYGTCRSEVVHVLVLMVVLMVVLVLDLCSSSGSAKSVQTGSLRDQRSSHRNQSKCMWIVFRTHLLQAPGEFFVGNGLTSRWLCCGGTCPRRRNSSCGRRKYRLHFSFRTKMNAAGCEISVCLCEDGECVAHGRLRECHPKLLNEL